MSDIKLADLSTWNDWDIGCVLDRYVDAVNLLGPDEDKDVIKKQFIKYIKLQVINDGHVMFTPEFAETVKCGGFNRFDGFGRYMDENGEEHGYVDFNASNILKNAEEFPYVCWYNK